MRYIYKGECNDHLLQLIQKVLSIYNNTVKNTGIHSSVEISKLLERMGENFNIINAIYISGALHLVFITVLHR